MPVTTFEIYMTEAMRTEYNKIFSEELRVGPKDDKVQSPTNQKLVPQQQKKKMSENQKDQ